MVGRLILQVNKRYKMINFQTEKYIECIAEMQPMFEAQWKEVEGNQDELPLEPDYAQYQKLCEADMLKIVTARLDGELIGYLVTFVVPHLHHMNTRWASSDIFYIKPKYRNTAVAAKLIHMTENLLRDKGVKMLSLHMKAHVPFDKLAEGCGFDKFEITYSKYIG